MNRRAMSLAREVAEVLSPAQLRALARLYAQLADALEAPAALPPPRRLYPPIDEPTETDKASARQLLAAANYTRIK